MLYNVANLEKLSDGKIQLMEYPSTYYGYWKDRQTEFFKSSAAPNFIKDILIYKNEKRPHLFFGEAYVAMVLGNSVDKGWFNSWEWLSSDDWSNGIYSSDDSFILEMMHQFYEDALHKYLSKKLPKILDIQSHFSMKPEPPDLWLIGRNRKHHFIEVKRGNDRLSDEQLLGLLLIHTILRYTIHIVWLYDGKEAKPPSDGKIAKYAEKYNKLKDKLDEVIGGDGSLESGKNYTGKKGKIR